MPEHGTANPDPPNPDPRIPNPDPDRRCITLTPDMIQRAGIKTVTAIKATATTRLHLPGVVQPNAYKNVDVTSLVSGRVTQVRAELGQRVMANEVLATVYSPELADAQTAFIAARAAARRARPGARTDAAPVRDWRGQPPGARAARRRGARRWIARSRPRAPGWCCSAFPRRTRAAARLPRRRRDDVRREGADRRHHHEAQREPRAEHRSRPRALFTVTDLSTVWVIADLYERDFASVGVGSPATITSTAYPGWSSAGRVNYIDPQVQPETRTAKLRAEVPNAGNRLRFGMFVDVSIGARQPRPVVMVPKVAVQTVGAQSVVYVSDDAAAISSSAR